MSIRCHCARYPSTFTHRAHVYHTNTWPWQARCLTRYSRNPKNYWRNDVSLYHKKSIRKIKHIFKKEKEKSDSCLLNVCQCELQYLDMTINAKSPFSPGLARFINSRVLIYLLRMVVRLSRVRMLDILVFILCHLSHLHVLWVIPNGHSIGHSMQFLVGLVILRRRLL